jgi:hypothetical protein
MVGSTDTQSTVVSLTVGASCQLGLVPSHATSDSTVKETSTTPLGAQKGAGGFAVTLTVGGPEPVSVTTLASCLEQMGAFTPVTLTVKLKLNGMGRPGGILDVLQL